MENPLKILYIHDDASNTLQLNEALHKAQFSFEEKMVDTKEKFQKYLNESLPDIILFEQKTSSFSPIDALEIIEKKCLKIPLILLCDHLPIEQIVETIKAGASDYVSKDHPERLLLAIHLSLQKRQLEIEREEYIHRLETAETRFRALVEHAVDAVVILNPDGKPLYASPSIKKVLGYTQEETLDLSLYEVIHPDDRMYISERMAECISKPGVSLPMIQCRCKHKNGNWVWYEGTITNMLHDPAINGIVDNFHDITDKKTAELELRESEEKYRFLFEYSASPKWIFDLETFEIVDVNETAVKVYGYSREEFIGMNSNLLKVPEELPRIAEIQQSLKKVEGLIHFGIFTQLKKDGTRIKADVSGHKVYFNNRPCMVIDSYDVTERENTLQQLKESEEKLKESRLRYEMISNATSDAIWDWDFTRNKAYRGDRFETIFGHSVKENKLEDDFWESNIHPQDRERVLANIEQAIKSNQSNWSLEYRFRKADNSYAHVLDKGFFIRDENGKAIRLAGGMQDITGRKELEDLLEKATKLARIGSYEYNIQNNHSMYWSSITKEIHEVETDYVLTLEKVKDFYKAGVDLELITQAFDNAVKKGIPFDVEIPIITGKGNNRWIRVIGETEFVNGKCTRVYGSVQDIDQRKKAEEALRISNKRYAIVAKATNDSIWDWDFGTNRVERPDKPLESLLGYQHIAPFEVDSFWESHVHPEDWKRITESRNTLFENPNENYWEDEYRFLKPDGSYATVYDRGYIIRDNNGKAVRMIGASRDISKLKESEIQLKLLNNQLELRAKELVASNQELEQFAYVASHDLQEPLRMVSNFLTQIEKKYNDILDEKGKTYIHFAVDGAKRMRQMILDLLEFSRAGRNVDQPEEVDLNILVKDILSLHLKQIEETKAIVQVSDLPTLAVPKTGIRQVFQNLVSNSLKYNQLKKVVVPHIEIRAKNYHSYWQFEIKDNGIGIDSQYFEKIFIIFQRLHDRSEYSGTGIGLAITKKIVENFGGKIWIESEIEKGSSFFFTIPNEVTLAPLDSKKDCFS